MTPAETSGRPSAEILNWAYVPELDEVPAEPSGVLGRWRCILAAPGATSDDPPFYLRRSVLERALPLFQDLARDGDLVGFNGHVTLPPRGQLLVRRPVVRYRDVRYCEEGLLAVAEILHPNLARLLGESNSTYPLLSLQIKGHYQPLPDGPWQLLTIITGVFSVDVVSEATAGGRFISRLEEPECP